MCNEDYKTTTFIRRPNYEAAVKSIDAVTGFLCHRCKDGVAIHDLGIMEGERVIICDECRFELDPRRFGGQRRIKR